MNFERTLADSFAERQTGPGDLAHIATFALGAITIVPPERRVESWDGRAVTLEPLAMQVLVALAAAEGRTLSRDDLVGECWGRRIVGDDAVNRVISRLRKNLAEVCGNRVRIETIAKVGYRLEAQPADSTAEATGSSPWQHRWTSRHVLIGVLSALAVPLVIVGGSMTLLETPAAGVSIAIAPAAGMDSNDRLSTSFASEFTDDIAQLTGSLTRVTLVEPSAASDASMMLQVSYHPAMKADSARVRLVDGHSGTVLWSRTFEGGGSEEITRERAAYATAGLIRCGLDRATGDLGDPVSQRLYFSACDAVYQRDWPTALSFAEQIVKLRPDSAASWACLSLTTVHVGARLGPEGRESAAREAMNYARKSLAIDPKSGLAHQSLAVALEMQGKSGFRALEEGVRLDPEHSGLMWRYSWGLFDLGYVKAAVEPALRAVALDPGDRGTAGGAFYTLLGAGRIADARRMSERIGRLWSAERGGDPRINLLFFDPDPRHALAQYDTKPPDDPLAGLTRAELVWRINPEAYDWAAFDRLANGLYRADASSAWDTAFSAARMRDNERAFAWLDRAQTEPGSQPWFTLFWNDIAPLRRDPRFFAKMAQLGLVDEWRRRDRWPDFCSEPNLRYDCRTEAAKFAAAPVTPI